MKRLHGLYIIDDESGVCIYHQDFKDENELDPRLVGCFFNAIMLFSKNFSGQGIEYVQLEHIRLFFKIKERLLYALVADNALKHGEASQFIDRLANRFIDKFNHVLGVRGEPIDQVRFFKAFAEDVEAEIGCRSSNISFVEELPSMFQGRGVDLRDIQNEYRRFASLFEDQAKKVVALQDHLHVHALREKEVDREKIKQFTSHYKPG